MGCNYNKHNFTIKRLIPERITKRGIALFLFFLLAGNEIRAQSGARPRIQVKEDGNDATPVSFHIFPNPNEGKFTVTVKEMEQSYDINVYNLIGEMVYHWESNGSAGEKTEINLSKQPKGIYLVELDTEGRNLIKKVVVDNDKGG